MRTEKSEFIKKIRSVMRLKQLALKTEDTYIEWIKRFIRFHKMAHPISMGKKEIEEFLTYLAVNNTVAPSTQNTAFHAILFMFKEVLDMKIEDIDALRSKKKRNLPVVMSFKALVQKTKDAKLRP